MSERSNNKKERDECLTIDTLNMEEFESYLFVPIHLLTQRKGTNNDTFFRIKTKQLSNKHVRMKRPREKGARHIQVFGVIFPNGRVDIIRHKRIILKNWEYIIVT